MNPEKKKIVSSFYAPLIFVLILWIVKFIEIAYNIDLARYGVVPRNIDRLSGILTMPFIHSDFKHLFSNSIPLLILGASLVYFYRESALKVFLLIYILHGIWLWFGGRPSYHIGASGIVYGLASFLFFSGIFRRYMRLMAISLLVVFLYGSMIWGIFPLFIGMSWEAHLAGSIAGVVCAWIYRKEGPQRPVYEWEDEDDELPAEAAEGESGNIIINYEYKPDTESLKEDADDKN